MLGQISWKIPGGSTIGSHEWPEMRDLRTKCLLSLGLCVCARLVFFLCLLQASWSPCPFLQVRAATRPLYRPRPLTWLAVLLDCASLPSSFPVTNVWGCECASLSLSLKYVCSYCVAQLFLLYTCRHLCLTVLVWGPCGEGGAPVSPASLIHCQRLWVCVSVCLLCSALLRLSSLCRLSTCSSECSAPNWFLSSQRPHNFVAPRSNHLSMCLCLNLRCFF